MADNSYIAWIAAATRDDGYMLRITGNQNNAIHCAKANITAEQACDLVQQAMKELHVAGVGK